MISSIKWSTANCSWDDIADLREIVGGEKQGRRSATDITVFKNNGGQGIAELAIGDLILTRARGANSASTELAKAISQGGL